MKYYSLTDEEQKELDEIEAALENGTLESVADFEEEKKRLQQIARNTLNKTRNINIRLSERDLYKLKAKAIEEGIPYQTLASSILHKATAEK
jgi:predicted DNA binding CopG/RHH family protein